MLIDSARRWANARRTDGDTAQDWRDMATLGWLGLGIPEDDGGLGGGLPEQALVAEELGRALRSAPYVPCAVLGAGLMVQLAPAPLRASALPALVAGERRVAWVWRADGQDRCRSASGVVAQDDAGGWRLDGMLGLTPGADDADTLLVAGVPGQRPDECGLFLIECDQPGVTVDRHALYDGRQAASVVLNGVRAQLLHAGDSAALGGALDQAFDRGLIAHAAETLGTAQAAYEITLDYVRTRRQFGRAIGQNQVVQHRLVDLYVDLHETRALCLRAATDPSPRQVAALGLRLAEVARHTWQEAIQLHGAIGMTEECRLGAHVRRLALAADLYGDRPEHAERLAALSLKEPA
jgi:butyryl-CoA dehydrogenase